MSSIIALLTDFGTQDAYVGIMKGVIAGIAPQARIIDITHEIAPQDLGGAAYTLLCAYRYFPAGTIFCCVVDPGVGSARRAVAVQVRSPAGDDYVVVCPDNGLLTPVLEQASATAAHALNEPRYQLRTVSATFHGRDIFAPAAAHLAAGTGIAALGAAVAPAELVRMDWPQPQRTRDGWLAHVIHIDRFGNLITNLAGGALDAPGERWRVRLGDELRIDGIRGTFADTDIGAPVAYVGSSGFLEVAVRNGSAQRAWGLGVGDTINVERA
ncbi:MAG TPA: SAM-dependent chlorinase/fluorinase [Gammaproteobacteria bacterium]|nr:SAM-dependent chlorinase/fluorinase [Gammaproteobacteria bacterium]